MEIRFGYGAGNFEEPQATECQGGKPVPPNGRPFLPGDGKATYFVSNNEE
jgi:hypothetical protein